jgi:hypothetical protein
VQRWQQPLRKPIARLYPPKGTIRRNYELWRSRRLICQTRTCRWPNGQRLASQGNYAFCAYLRIQWEHYHREGHDARHISICSLFQGRFVAACYVKPKKGFPLTHSTVGGGLWVAYGWQDHALRLERTPPFPNLALFLPTASRIRPSVTRIVYVPICL